MPASEEQIIAKISGTIAGLSRMTPKERQEMPTIAFGDDYNKSRALALELRPDLSEVFPPILEIIRNQPQLVVRARYSEIIAYCQQIIHLFNRPVLPMQVERD